MADTAIERLSVTRARSLRRSTGAQLLDLREERGLSQREVAAAIGLDRSWLSKAESGDANLTIEALAKIATVLGVEASLRLYPATGPRLHDHTQVTLIEALLALLHARWRARLEVPVYRPARGVIDLMLSDAEAGQLVSGEVQSEIRRAERQLRWAAEKADALPSADGWPWMDGHPRTSRLLLLRSTAATRAVVHSSPNLFAAAYPGRAADAVEALQGPSASFPEAAIVWVDLRGTASRVLDGPPRGIVVGR
ncbi:MAG TPA: helix-turn-helix transcriptional regulator [Candidatus Limnocylindrales bacterium]|jgi:transcriptional regulator with XRE-family HTH domain